MSPEDWKAHLQQWHQRGGQESAKAPDPNAPQADDSGGSWLGSAGAFGKGIARELATQAGGPLKDFGAGSDPNHPTAEWLGREATDLAPAAAIDAFAPEVALPLAATRLGKLGNLANEAINAGTRGAIGGAAANPGDRATGATTGAIAGAGSGIAGQAIRKVSPALWPAAIATEMMRHNIDLPFIYPWAMMHGVSALGALARSAGVKAPALTGAGASQMQRSLSGDGD